MPGPRELPLQVTRSWNSEHRSGSAGPHSQGQGRPGSRGQAAGPVAGGHFGIREAWVQIPLELSQAEGPGVNAISLGASSIK